MKKELLLFMLLTLCTAFTLQAQDSLHLKKIITYKIKLEKLTGETVKGYLKQVTDSTVAYSVDKTSYGAVPVASDGTMHYSIIKKIKLRRSGKTGRAMAIGTGAGAATGAIIGFASGDDDPTPRFLSNPHTAGEKAAGFAIVLGLAGAAIGALSGIPWRKYGIDGKIENLAVLRLEVQKKVYGTSSD